MDLKDFGRALRRFWPLSLLVLVATLALGYVAATASGPSFRSTVTLSISPNPAEANGVDQVGFELPVIVELIDSRALGQQLQAQRGAPAGADVPSLAATREIDSNIIRIEAEGSDAQAVADIANAAAATVVARYQPTDADPLTPPTRGDLVTVDVIDEAVVDTGSGHPNRNAIMLATFALGLILAGLAAALAQRWSRARDLEGRIRTEVGVPVLSVIPSTRELDEVGIHDLLRTGPAAFVEAFQTLRSRTELLLPESESVLAISSWQRREGRTSVTAGLGLMLAAVGERAVVVDCNLRKPDLAETLGEPGRAGLAELAELGGEDFIHPTQHPRLDLIPAGVAHSHPAQLLAVALPTALDAIWERSPRSVVLLDAPPLGPVLRGAVQRTAETSTVLGVANRVLLVVDASHRHLDAIAAGVERLEEEGVTVIGVVVNRRRWRNRWTARRRPGAAGPVIPASSSPAPTPDDPSRPGRGEDAELPSDSAVA